MGAERDEMEVGKEGGIEGIEAEREEEKELYVGGGVPITIGSVVQSNAGEAIAVYSVVCPPTGLSSCPYS
jgi:hypothetical protein